MRIVSFNSPLFRKISHLQLSFFNIEQAVTMQMIKMKFSTLQQRIHSFESTIKRAETVHKTLPFFDVERDGHLAEVIFHDYRHSCLPIMK